MVRRSNRDVFIFTLAGPVSLCVAQAAAKVHGLLSCRTTAAGTGVSGDLIALGEHRPGRAHRPNEWPIWEMTFSPFPGLPGFRPNSPGDDIRPVSGRERRVRNYHRTQDLRCRGRVRPLGQHDGPIADEYFVSSYCGNQINSCGHSKTMSPLTAVSKGRPLRSCQGSDVTELFGTGG